MQMSDGDYYYDALVRKWQIYCIAQLIAAIPTEGFDTYPLGKQ